MASELERGLVYSDLRITPDDGKRYELIRGEMFVTPSPSPLHQRISKRLQRQLEAYFEERSLGEVFNAPIDLILTERDVFVPDLVVVTTPDDISKRGIEAAPALVVEVLSPSTRRHDRGLKARRYAELGVEHYWIVDPERKLLEFHRREHTTFRPLAEVDGDVTYEHPDWDGLVIDLAALWR